MAKELTHTELMRIIANEAKLSEKSTKKVYEALVKVVREEVRRNGQCRLQNLGNITTILYGGHDMKKSPLVGGEGEKLFIQPRNVPKFKFSANFKDWVAGRPVSHEGKRRKRKGEVSQTDKELEEVLRLERACSVEAMIKEKAATGRNLKEIASERESQKKYK